jgi:hypothetical protein
MDLFMKQGAGYALQATTAHRFRFPGNWKIQLEKLWPLPRSSTKPLPSTKLSISSVCLSTELKNDLWERFSELAQALREEGHDEQQVRRIVRAVGGSGFNQIFHETFAVDEVEHLFGLFIDRA